MIREKLYSNGGSTMNINTNSNGGSTMNINTNSNGGSTMNIKEVIALIDGRIDTLNTKCISATKHNPDYYKSLKELRLTSFIKQLMLRIYPNDEDIVGQGDCETIISLCVTKGVTTIEVKEGDNVLDLLDRYKDVKDVYNKIKKACGDKGLTIKGSNIVKI